jgi:CzcA family heavy metal efflux pump
MLDGIIRWSLRNRLVTIFGAATLLAAGAYSGVTIPIDVFPDLTAPTVTVLTEAHGMATEEVEILVTFPIETAVNGAAGVRRVRSSSAQGISIVWIEFDWGQDIYRARQIVSEKLQLVVPQLPAGVSPPVLAPITSIMGEILLVGMSSDRHSAMEVRTVADWVVRKRLLAVPGVSQVVPIGGAVKQYQVLLDPQRLRAYGVGIDEVLRAAERSNAVASGGVFLQSGQEILIRGLGRVRNLEDIEHTVVALRDGVPVLIGDVGEVRLGPKQRFGAASVNAEPAVILSIQKQPNANTLELTERIDAELETLEDTLPEGMMIDRGIFRQASFISLAVGNVIEAVRDGAVLVTVILFLFLWSFRTTAISVLAIPLSLAMALVAMKLLGISINTMTLGGMAIAIGALVDDAIIGVENAFRRLREDRRRPDEERRPALKVVYQATLEIREPIVKATIIISIVFVPLFFLSGVEGRMLRPLGFSYVVSILASLLVAVSVTPVLCAFLLPTAPAMMKDTESWLAEALKRAYGRVLPVVLDHPRPIVGMAAALVVVTLTVFPLLGRGFLPEFQEGTLTVSAVTMPGTGIDESDQIGGLVERKMLSHPAVVSTARRTGRAELDEHAQGVNGAEIDVLLDLSAGELPSIMNDLRGAVASVPGTNVTIGQPIGHRIDHMLSGTRAAIAIKIFGPDLLRLRRLAERVRGAIEDVPGLVDLSVEQQADVPQLRIIADREAMAKYGVTAGSLAEAVDVAFYGEPVAQVLEGQSAFDLVVRFGDEHRESAEDIREALVDTPLGPKVELAMLANVVEDRGPNTISRENVQRKIVVQSNVSGRDVGSVVDEIESRIEASIDLPPGYYIQYGGQFESGYAAAQAIAVLSILSVVAIFLILFQEFGSARTAILVMVNLPLALVGGVVALLASGGDLKDDGESQREAVFRGSLERLNPILMTALTTALALIPLALGGGEPGKEIQAPLAVVVLGGLLSSTALNMVVVPALFLRYGVPARRGDAEL